MVKFDTKILADSLSSLFVGTKNVPFRVIGQMLVAGVVTMFVAAFIDALNNGDILGAVYVLLLAFVICLVIGIMCEVAKNYWGINLYKMIGDMLQEGGTSSNTGSTTTTTNNNSKPSPVGVRFEKDPAYNIMVAVIDDPGLWQRNGGRVVVTGNFDPSWLKFKRPINGVMQICESGYYDPATNTIYANMADVFGPSMDKTEIDIYNEMMASPRPIEYIVNYIEANKLADITDVKLHVVLSDYLINEWRDKGVLQSYVENEMKIAYENWISRPQDMQVETAKMLYDKYVKNR